VDFAPADPSLVTVYTCGITPYDATHIGHAAVFLTFDVLRRHLQDSGVSVRCVRNITDVDDDILRKAAELGVHYLDLAAEEIARFRADMAALSVAAPASEPRATSAIPEILSLVDVLLERGYAYQAGGSVYFEAARSDRYGQLSHLDRDVMLRLAAERGGRTDDPAKRDPLDFVLWQEAKPGEPSWESRWGAGRPGWHVECSALALRELGRSIDIHGGGADLIFPHHECEAAQSEAATGEPFVRHWMHVAMVRLGGEKMSKSLGNLIFVSDLLKTWEPDVVRLAVLSHHYRESWEWEDWLLDAASARIRCWREAASRDDIAGDREPERAGDGDGLLAEVRARLDDDLDVPGVMAALDEAACHPLSASGSEIARAANLIGIRL